MESKEKLNDRMDKAFERSECAKCKKMTPAPVLLHNSKFGAYGFKLICDECSDKMDDEIDSYMQDNAGH